MEDGSSDPVAHKPAGYEALTSDAGAYEDPSRLVFRAEGKKAQEMLNAVVTADLAAVPGDAAFPTLILTPKGRVLADAVVIHLGGEVFIDVPAPAWPGLEKHFGVYVPPRFVRLEPAGLRVVRIHGPWALNRERTNPILASLDRPTYTQRDGSHCAVAAFNDGFVVRLAEGFDLYLPPESAHGLDVPEVSDEAWEVWRIERGIPAYGRDITSENLPQETGLVPEYVSFEKGCYTGQEVVARIHYRGHVNRHLWGLHVVGPSTGEPLHPGDQLTHDGKVVGTVTSAALSPVHGWMGMGYVRREIEPGMELMVRSPGEEPDIPVYAIVTSLPIQP
jgi:folate-binding protein YgfZ